MNHKYLYHKFWSLFLSALIFITAVLISPAESVHAAQPDYNAEAEARKSLPIQSNETPGWPEGPAIGADSAILMEADSGTVLYAKNIHKHEFPASVTKILTTLIALENCELDETVTFSNEAVFSIPKDSSNIAIDVGEELTVNQCLQAILIASANEVANALGEHVAGSIDGFVKLMNEKAAELGCVDSHFVTTNGLHDDNHYTSAYDLAMIGRHFFASELLCSYASCSKLEIPATSKQPDDIVAWSKNELYEGRKNAYEYLVASKTGYTDTARQTLVSCAEKDGMRLICVVLKEESPSQYTDTVDLFNYGFSNFQKINVSKTETKYQINTSDFFYSNNDILGNSKPLLEICKDDCIIIPKTAEFDDTESEIDYESVLPGAVATISYLYNNAPVGTASINLTENKYTRYPFDGEMTAGEIEEAEKESGQPTVYINIRLILLSVLCIAGIIILFMFLHAYLKTCRIHYRKRRKISKKSKIRNKPTRKLRF